MEAELRETLREMRAGVSELAGKVDTYQQTLMDHIAAHAAQHQEVLGSSKASHRRLDEHMTEHRETKKWWGALWLGVVMAFISSAAAALMAFVKRI